MFFIFVTPLPLKMPNKMFNNIPFVIYCDREDESLAEVAEAGLENANSPPANVTLPWVSALWSADSSALFLPSRMTALSSPIVVGTRSGVFCRTSLPTTTTTTTTTRTPPPPTPTSPYTEECRIFRQIQCIECGHTPMDAANLAYQEFIDFSCTEIVYEEARDIDEDEEEGASIIVPTFSCPCNHHWAPEIVASDNNNNSNNNNNNVNCGDDDDDAEQFSMELAPVDDDENIRARTLCPTSHVRRLRLTDIMVPSIAGPSSGQQTSPTPPPYRGVFWRPSYVHNATDNDDEDDYDDNNFNFNNNIVMRGYGNEPHSREEILRINLEIMVLLNDITTEGDYSLNDDDDDEHLFGWQPVEADEGYWTAYSDLSNSTSSLDVWQFDRHRDTPENLSIIQQSPQLDLVWDDLSTAYYPTNDEYSPWSSNDEDDSTAVGCQRVSHCRY